MKQIKLTMRLASLFLSICMAMTLQPFIALAEETGSGDISGYISGGDFPRYNLGQCDLNRGCFPLERRNNSA